MVRGEAVRSFTLMFLQMWNAAGRESGCAYQRFLPEPEAEPEPAQEEPAPAGDSDIRPEIKDAIDTYEEFFNEYVDFMKSYDASDISALSDYLSFLQEYTEYMQKLDDLENEDLTDAETIYLTQATLRIDQRLLEVVN